MSIGDPTNIPYYIDDCGNLCRDYRFSIPITFVTYGVYEKPIGLELPKQLELSHQEKTILYGNIWDWYE